MEGKINISENNSNFSSSPQVIFLHNLGTKTAGNLNPINALNIEIYNHWWKTFLIWYRKYVTVFSTHSKPVNSACVESEKPFLFPSKELNKLLKVAPLLSTALVYAFKYWNKHFLQRVNKIKVWFKIKYLKDAYVAIFWIAHLSSWDLNKMDSKKALQKRILIDIQLAYTVPCTCLFTAFLSLPNFWEELVHNLPALSTNLPSFLSFPHPPKLPPSSGNSFRRTISLHSGINSHHLVPVISLDWQTTVWKNMPVFRSSFSKKLRGCRGRKPLLPNRETPVSLQFCSQGK